VRGDTNRGLPLLRQRRVVDDEKTRVIADQAICLLQEGRLERNPVPHPGGDKMMKLIVADVANPRGHRLYALTVTWPDQTGNIERAHPAPRGMRKPCQKRLKPSLQIVPPGRVHHHCRSNPAAHTDTGINDDSSRFHQPAKVVLGVFGSGTFLGSGWLGARGACLALRAQP
jgi:hypothetical protein